MARKLSAEERRLWAKVVAAVRPLHERPDPLPEPDDGPPLRPPIPRRPNAVSYPAPATAPAPGETLDGAWERRLARGIARPDRTVDLHGHSLASAHAMLDARLEEAIAAQARLVLLITGKQRKDGRAGRGAIRAAIGDWLAASRHAGEIAAIRGAHPRHGGAGALYLILRRPKSRNRQNS